MTVEYPSPRTTDHAERNRYNAAFDELGLEWHWDEQTYAELQKTLEKNPVHVFIETRVPHLLRAYDTDFLVKAIEAMRTRLGGPQHA